MESQALFNIFIFLLAACIVVPIASQFKLGSVLGYLAAGILIGPFGVGFIENSEQIMHFAEFGVVMMLFVIGLELEPAMLWRMKRAIVGLGGLQVIITTTAFALIGILLGYSWQASLAVGMALALSSTALVLQMLQEKNLMNTAVGETSFAVLLFQDIAVIGMLVILPLLAMQSEPQEHAAWYTELPAAAHALLIGMVVAGVIIVGKYLSHHMFYFIAKTNIREVFTATSLMLVVGITLLMQMVGISPALGAFLAGVVLANSEYKHTLETDIEPFKGLLLGLFFISVGMGMNFSLFSSYGLDIAFLVVGILLIKAIILLFLGGIFGLIRLHNIGFALALCQGGEFAFVLLQLAGNFNIIESQDSAKLTLAVALSIASTPLLMLVYNSWIVPRFMSVLPEQQFDHFDARNSVVIAGFGRFGQVIGRFLIAQKIPVTLIEKDPDQISLLRKFGFKGYFGDASRLELLRNAHTDKASLFVIAADDAETSLKIAQLVKKEFPQLKVFARARNRRHAYELTKIGVEFFKRETFDSSLSMAEDIMVTLGFNADEMKQKAAQFKQHDEETLRKSFNFFDSDPELINFARQRTGELSQILTQDEQKSGYSG